MDNTVTYAASSKIPSDYIIATEICAHFRGIYTCDC